VKNRHVSFIGCGLIGEKRSQALPDGTEVCSFYDVDSNASKKLAMKRGGSVAVSLEDILKDQSEVVVIATPHARLFDLAKVALNAGKNVLLEKPGGIQVGQIETLMQISKENSKHVKIGFNHRFHPSIMKAKAIQESSELGEILNIRTHYGHGGRIGYENEWRCKPELSGGGELIDQGVHLLDLYYWFLGPLPLKSTFATTAFWNTPVEDNAVLTFSENPEIGRKWGSLSVSFTEWKNQFRMEIYFKTGKLLLEGLGGSYGPEQLTVYRMPAEMGPPSAEKFEYSNEPDLSWRRDLENLFDHIDDNKPLLGGLDSAHYALSAIRQTYQENGYRDLPCSV